LKSKSENNIHLLYPLAELVSKHFFTLGGLAIIHGDILCCLCIVNGHPGA